MADTTMALKAQVSRSTEKPKVTGPGRRCASVDQNIYKQLAEAGWGAGFKLPFANQENKELEQLLEKKQIEILDLRSVLNDDTDHANEMKKHLLRLEQTLSASHNILSAKKAEFESEKAATALAERFKERTAKETVTTNKLLTEYTSNVEFKLESFEHRRQIVKELMELTDFNGRALQAWADKTEDTQENIEDTEWYKVMDDDKEKELFVRSANLHSQNREMRDILYTLSTDTMKAQESFSRATNKFRKLNANRKDTIKLWVKTLEAIKTRDKKIDELAEEYFGLREEKRELEAGITTHEEGLRTAQELGREVKFEIRELERTSDGKRTRLSNAREHHTHLNEEYLTVRMSVSNVAGSLKKCKAAILNAEQELGALGERAAAAEAQNIVLASELEGVRINRDDENKSVQTFEFILNEQTDKSAQTWSEIEKFRKMVYQLNNEKVELKHQFTLVQAKLETAKNAVKRANSEDAKNDDQKTRCEAILFHLDLETRRLEKRISELLSGSNALSEYIIGQNKLKVMKHQIEQVMKEKIFAQKELRQNEIRLLRYQAHIRSAQKENRAVETDLVNIARFSQFCEQEMVDANNRIKKCRIEQCLERVILKRLQDGIDDAQCKMCTLSNHWLLMESAIKERRQDIQNHIRIDKDILKSLRSGMDEVKTQIMEVTKNIARQKLRFGVISDVMERQGKSNQGGDNAFCNTLYCVIKEREELTRAKGEWEAKVLEAEKELEGLTNTSKIMETSNCAFKSSLAPALKSSEEFTAFAEIEAEEKGALVRKHNCVKQTRKLQDGLSDLRISINMTKQFHQSISFVATAKMRHASKLSNELTVQRDKIIRWTNLVAKILDGIKKTENLVNKEILASIELDLKVRFLKEKYEFGVLMVEKLVGYFEYVKEAVLRLATKDGPLRAVAQRVELVGTPGYKNTSRYAPFVQLDPYISFVNDLYGRSQSTGSMKQGSGRTTSLTPSDIAITDAMTRGTNKSSSINNLQKRPSSSQQQPTMTNNTSSDTTSSANTNSLTSSPNSSVKGQNNKNNNAKGQTKKDKKSKISISFKSNLPPLNLPAIQKSK